MDIRYGMIATSEIEWRYLRSGTGSKLAGYDERVFNCGPQGKQWIFGHLERTQKFFTRLVESIKVEGVRNPLCLFAIEEGNFIHYGGGRMWACNEAGLTEVPVVVFDWVGRFPTFELLATEEEVRSKFKDNPNTLVIDPEGVRVCHCDHSHLPDMWKTNPGWIQAQKWKALNERKAKERRLAEQEV